MSNIEVFYFLLIENNDVLQRLNEVMDSEGYLTSDIYESFDQIILLIDDAQNCFPTRENSSLNQPFWSLVGKGKISPKLKIVISVTYLFSGGSSPIELHSYQDMQRLSRSELLLSEMDSKLIFSNEVNQQYPKLIDVIVNDCNGHAGALAIARDEIDTVISRNRSIPPNEDDLILRYLGRFDKLERCFGNLDAYRKNPMSCEIL